MGMARAAGMSMNREQLEQAEKETRAAYERAQEQINRFDPHIIAGE